MKAVILSAGTGTRLREVLNGKPKPLLEVRGKSLLMRSVESLAEAGIDDIVIALGFRGEMVKSHLADIDCAKISYRRNPIYSMTGSMHSLYLALEKPQNCLVLDGDIIYHPLILQDLLSQNLENCVILSPISKSGDEVHVSMNSSGKIVYLGKQLSPGQVPKYEFTGISRFSRKFMQEMFEIHLRKMKIGEREDYYEDCAYQASRSISWRGIVSKRFWSEIDTPKDLDRVNKTLRGISVI